MFGSNKSKTQSLVKKSSGVLDIFRSTLANLTAVNGEMVVENERLETEQEAIAAAAAVKIAERQSERDILSKEIKDNEVVAAKIESFWETPVFDNHKEEGHDPQA